MASLDSLPADQKAVLSLVLQRGRSYDQIAGMLSIDRAAVRQRALEGFDALGPQSTLQPLKRALITDYLLGQLPPQVADNVRNSLSTTPPERAWARVVAAELAPLAPGGLPEIPAAGAAAASVAPAAAVPTAAPVAPAAGVPAAVAETELEAAPAVGTPPAGTAPAAAAAAPESGTAPAAPAAPGDLPPSSRRGGAVLLGLIALVVVVVVVVLLVTGKSTKKSPAAHRVTTPAVTVVDTTATGTSAAPTSTTAASTTAPTALHQISLTSPTAVKGRQGAADVVRADGKLGLVIVAEGLVANAKNAYGVWLYNSKTSSGKFLGFYSQKVTATGSGKSDLEAEVALPSNATSYNELLLTLETVEKPTSPGTIVLQGAFAE